MPWEDQEGGQLVWVTSPCLENTIPEVGTLEDPNDSRPIHIGNKKNENCIIPMPRRKNVFQKLFQGLKHNYLRKLHVNNIIFI